MSTQRIDASRLKRPHNGRNEYPITPRTIDGDQLEFVMAVDAYKQANKLSFLRTSEIYNLMLFLGYRKVAPQMSQIGDVPRLAPTGQRGLPAESQTRGESDPSRTPKEAVLREQACTPPLPLTPGRHGPRG